MEKLSVVLILIGVCILIFSIWNFFSLKKHLRQFKNNYRKTSSLTDEKYYELKSKQEYIIAVSAIIFSIISFIGYTSIDNIKTDMSDRLKAEIAKIDTLNKKANENYSGLEIRGKTYGDSVQSALKLVVVLNQKMKQLFEKDVITQNIYIVDSLRIGDFPKEKTGTNQYDEGYHVIKYNILKTINGKRLPVFKSRPSIICMASSIGSVKLKEIQNDRFVVQLESYLPKNDKDRGDDVTFTAWISQKPESNP